MNSEEYLGFNYSSRWEASGRTKKNIHARQDIKKLVLTLCRPRLSI